MGYGGSEARASAFTMLVVANLTLILINRSWSGTILASLKSPNPALWWISSGALILLSLVLYVPFLRELFRFSILPPSWLAVSITAGIASVIWFDALKKVMPTHGEHGLT